MSVSCQTQGPGRSDLQLVVAGQWPTYWLSAAYRRFVKPLHKSTLISYLAETKTMARQLSYGGHADASEAARNLARELDKDLERLFPKPKAQPRS